MLWLRFLWECFVNILHSNLIWVEQIILWMLSCYASIMPPRRNTWFPFSNYTSVGPFIDVISEWHIHLSYTQNTVLSWCPTFAESCQCNDLQIVNCIDPTVYRGQVVSSAHPECVLHARHLQFSFLPRNCCSALHAQVLMAFSDVEFLCVLSSKSKWSV